MENKYQFAEPLRDFAVPFLLFIVFDFDFDSELGGDITLNLGNGARVINVDSAIGSTFLVFFLNIPHLPVSSSANFPSRIIP